MQTHFALLLCIVSVLAPATAGDRTDDAVAPEPSTVVADPAHAMKGVRQAERLRAQALGERDIETLRRLISGDYYHVESNGRVRTKTEFLQALARNEFRIRGYGVDDMEIKMVDDGGTAIVTGSYRATMQDQPAAQPVRGRYVRVWTRHPDGWRNALHQSTEIRPASPPPPKPAD